MQNLEHNKHIIDGTPFSEPTVNHRSLYASSGSLYILHRSCKDFLGLPTLLGATDALERVSLATPWLGMAKTVLLEAEEVVEVSADRRTSFICESQQGIA